MKEPVSFSNEDIEETGLNFFELRQKGLDTIQKLSGNIWTDFNSHDPGVTILEQLCYALTDISYRTSYPINDLLTPENKQKVNSKKNNAFFAPSNIYRTHPVTELDTKKMLLDKFDAIQNIWIKTTDNSGFEEKLVVTEKIVILPKVIFKNPNMEGSNGQPTLEKEVSEFFAKNRNLGEDVEDITVLKPKNLTIEFNIHLVPQKNIEKTLADLFLVLFEYIYCPVCHYTVEEMLEFGYSTSDIFSGPKLLNGFIRDDSLKERLTKIDRQGIQRVLSKVDDIYKCDVIKLHVADEKDQESIELKGDDFFHLLEDADSSGATDRYFRLYKNMKVFISNKEVETSSLNQQKIHRLFYELWAKKYRQYSIGDSQDNEFKKQLDQGKYRNPKDYYSIQNHFPLIYGIGKEGMPKTAPLEQRAKAKQLKAYLLFFEQHMANHLSQISHIGEFFNIDFKEDNKKTYFSQDLSNVPNIDGLQKNSELQTNETDLFDRIDLDRKDRVYDHLLARFGEEFNPLPWEVSRRMNLISSKEELQNILLERKSNYLLNIEDLSAERIKGEAFVINKEKKANKNERFPSGLENVILSKTGISLRSNRLLGSNNKTRDTEKISEETFYVVDHILLRDFLNDKALYGFKFVDALDNTICGTSKVGSWCGTKEERDNRIFQLYDALHDQDIFENDYKDFPLKSKDIRQDKDTSLILATFEKSLGKDEVLALIHLFNENLATSRRSRLRELEKIRAKGVAAFKRGVYGQRRLIYQRKLKDPKGNKDQIPIDEDFFNLSISIVLPIDKQRLKDLQLRSYMEDLIVERVPSHIKVNILWVDADQMNSFKKVYHSWEKIKVKAEKNSERLKKASYLVYCEVKKMIKEKSRKERNRAI